MISHMISSKIYTSVRNSLIIQHFISSKMKKEDLSKNYFENWILFHKLEEPFFETKVAQCGANVVKDKRKQRLIKQCKTVVNPLTLGSNIFANTWYSTDNNRFYAYSKQYILI